MVLASRLVCAHAVPMRLMCATWVRAGVVQARLTCTRGRGRFSDIDVRLCARGCFHETGTTYALSQLSLQRQLHATGEALHSRQRPGMAPLSPVAEACRCTETGFVLVGSLEEAHVVVVAVVVVNKAKALQCV
jgi:hypothetical protein